MTTCYCQKDIGYVCGLHTPPSTPGRLCCTALHLGDARHLHSCDERYGQPWQPVAR